MHTIRRMTKLAAGSIALLTSLVAANAGAQLNDVCVPPSATAPVIDGHIMLDAATDPADQAQLFDSGWQGATVIKLVDGIGTPTQTILRVLTTKDANGAPNAFYIGGYIDSHHAAAYDDTIVLGFSAGYTGEGQTGDNWRFQIQPFGLATLGGGIGGDDGGACSPNFCHSLDLNDPVPGNLSRAKYWTDSFAGPATWNTVAPHDLGSDTWVASSANFQFGTNGTAWSFEMKVPIVATSNIGGVKGTAGPAGIALNATENRAFRFYFNGIAVDDGNTTLAEYPWPGASLMGTDGAVNTLESLMPPLSKWGVVAPFSDPSCNKVTLDQANIGVELADGSITTSVQIPGTCTPSGTTQGPVNTFTARPHSTMTQPANLSVEFKYAVWGLQGTQFNFVDIPANNASVNPIPSVSIPAASDADITTKWALTENDACTFHKGMDHPCLEVFLTGKDAATTTALGNAPLSQQRNMVWVPASSFTDNAALNPITKTPNRTSYVVTKAQAVPMGAQAVFTKQPPPRCSAADPYRFQAPCCKPGEGAKTCAGAPAGWETLKYEVCGYDLSNRKISISKKAYKELQPYSCFGYFVTHNFEPGIDASGYTAWTAGLSSTDPGFKKIFDGKTAPIPGRGATVLEEDVVTFPTGAPITVGVGITGATSNSPNGPRRNSLLVRHHRGHGDAKRAGTHHRPRAPRRGASSRATPAEVRVDCRRPRDAERSGVVQ